MGVAVLKCPSCGAPATDGRRVCEFCGAVLLSNDLGMGLLDGDAAKVDKMVDAALAALEQDPNDAEAHCRLGAGYFKREQYDDAIAEFEKTLSLRPEAWGVLYLEAFACALGRSWCDPRIEQFGKRALELNPECREADSLLHLYAGQNAMEGGDPDYETAITEYKAALALQVPEHMPYVYDFAGQAFDEAEDKSDAINMYQEACRLGFVNAKILTRLGVLLKEAGKPQLAIAQLQKAQELDPINPAIKSLLAELNTGKPRA